MFLRRIFLAIIIVFAAGCSSLPFQTGTPDVGATPEATLAATPILGPVFTPSPPGEVTPSGPVTLILWLPQQFDPNSGTPAGSLLKDRLEEFSLRRPGVRLDVRLKTIDGTGGLLDSLTAASAAAPLALPDLIALPRPLMETAALKGLLQPLDGLTEAIDNPNWYDYARELSRLQETTFGLPLVGDALLLVYHPSAIAEPPKTWEEVLALENPLLFPAADPQALTTQAFYQSAGGAVQDEQGRPMLDVDILAQLLSFYQNGELNEVLPYWLSQYETFEQSWTGFQENPQAATVTWVSKYLSVEALLPDPGELTEEEDAVTEGELEEGELEEAYLAGAPLPTPSGEPFTLANGWVLSLAGSQPSKQALALELAEFLTESSFLAAWSEASGLLPPRSDVLEGWQDGSVSALVSLVAGSAHIYPSTDVLSSLAPAFQQVTLQILKQQGDPLSLAETAAGNLENP
jgi:multiple sugar transport system substrate-binding protein